MTRLACLLLAGLVLGTGTGCGYRAGGPWRSDIQTVHVETFGSKSFRREIEFMLTEAVKKRIGSETPYRLASRADADTILSGELVEQRVAALAPDPLSRQPREKNLTLIVRMQLKDVRSGRLLVDDALQLQSVDYLTPTGETERFAQERASDALAQKIVRKLYEDW